MVVLVRCRGSCARVALRAWIRGRRRPRHRPRRQCRRAGQLRRRAPGRARPLCHHEAEPQPVARTRADVLAKLLQAETPSLLDENRRLYRYLIEGVPVEVKRDDGSIGGEQARLIDFEHPDANDWLAVNQFTVIEHKATGGRTSLSSSTACRWESSSSRTPATRTRHSTARSTSCRPTRARSLRCSARTPCS